eukprot:3933602-Karenia_brevis.AAC.1
MGFSSSRKIPSGATGQPYLMCSYFAKSLGGGWVSLEGAANNPHCQCGAPWLITRATMFYWEGEGSLGAVHQRQLAKGIGKGDLPNMAIGYCTLAMA